MTTFWIIYQQRKNRITAAVITAVGRMTATTIPAVPNPISDPIAITAVDRQSAS